MIKLEKIAEYVDGYEPGVVNKYEKWVAKVGDGQLTIRKYYGSWNNTLQSSSYYGAVLYNPARRAHPYRCPKDFSLDMSMDEIMNSESMKKFLAKYADIP